MSTGFLPSCVHCFSHSASAGYEAGFAFTKAKLTLSQQILLIHTLGCSHSFFLDSVVLPWTEVRFLG